MRPTDSMPTMGRLVAAMLLGVFCYFAAGMVIEIWPDDENFGHFRLFCAIVGVAMGWRTTGSRLGRGLFQGMSAGLTGLGAAIFWIFLLLSFYEMILRSLERRYRTPFEAAQGMLQIAYDYALNILNPQFFIVLFVGALVIGLISELIAKIYR